jgi:hypothetical protein
MNISHTPRSALFMCALVLAGCSAGGSQPRFGPSAANAQPKAPISERHRDRRMSWIRPEASRSDLLYVSSNRSPAGVFVFSYPQLQLVGTLTGFHSPQGLCVDARGDVWVTDPGNQEIYEYAHGGTSPIATLSEQYYHPTECSVDPTTGTLAVVNGPTNGAPINVAIYGGVHRTPTYYAYYGVSKYYYCGYDNQGNLFVDAINQSSDFVLVELRARASAFNDVTLNQALAAPGALQFADHFLAILDEKANVIHQFAVNANGQGREVGETSLLGASNVVGQFWIENKRITVADFGALTTWLYNYPAGGDPFNALDNYGAPIGVTVSRAKQADPNPR